MLPIINTSLNRIVPGFIKDGIIIRIHWSSALNFLIQQTGTDLAAGSVTFSNLLFHYDEVTLTPKAMEDLTAQTGGIYTLAGNDYAGQPDVMDGTLANIKLGFGYAKVKKIYACIRTTAAINAVANSSNSYALSTLTKAELKLGNKLVNLSSWSFSETNNSIIAAEAMKVQKRSFMHPGGNAAYYEYSTSDMGTRTALQTAGQFYLVWDLTSGAETAVSEGGADVFNPNFSLTLSASADPAATVNVFCEYENEIVVDMSPGANGKFKIYS